MTGDIGLPPTQRSVSEWFNTSAFAAPATFTFGDAGVCIGRGPGLVNFDFSVLRTFRITERVHIHFRGEFFNASITPNLGNPGTAFGGAGFGVISTAGAARQIEVGGRVTF